MGPGLDERAGADNPRRPRGHGCRRRRIALILPSLHNDGPGRFLRHKKCNMRIVAVLVFASAVTIIASWAAAGEMTVELRVELCDISIIPDMERYNGEPHNRDECIENPDAYLKKIIAENQAISAGIVKKKQATRSAPVRISTDAQLACKTAIARQARSPGSVDFSFWGARKWRAPGGKTIMKGDVSFKNALGNMVPYIYSCEFLGDTVLKAEIFPR